MKCQRNYPKFCKGEAIGLVEGNIAICKGCKEFNEPIKKFNE